MIHLVYDQFIDSA